MKGLFIVNPAAYILEPKIRSTNINFDTYLHSYFPSAILFVEELSETLEYVNQTGIIILDFPRAFDDVNHSLLRHKLHHCGVQEESTSGSKTSLRAEEKLLWWTARGRTSLAFGQRFHRGQCLAQACSWYMLMTSGITHLTSASFY